MFYINLFLFSVMSLGSLHLFKLSLQWAQQAGSGCRNHSLSPVVAMGLYRVSPSEAVPSVFWLKTKCFKNQGSCQMPHPDFCFSILLPTGFEQQSFTHQISPGVSRNRATRFPLISHTGITHGSYSLPLSLPSSQSLRSMELLRAPLIGTGCFYRLLCLKQKHLAVPSGQLSPAKVTPLLGLGSGFTCWQGIRRWYRNAFLLFETAQTYWALVCRRHNLIGFCGDGWVYGGGGGGKVFFIASRLSKILLK